MIQSFATRKATNHKIPIFNQMKRMYEEMDQQIKQERELAIQAVSTERREESMWQKGSQRDDRDGFM